jgi:hypothetical protein
VIAIHGNSKYGKLDADKFPVLASLNISNSDGFVTQHYFDGMLTEMVYLLGKENRCIDYKNYKNGTSKRLVSIPKHDDGAVFLKMAHRPYNLWIESLIEFLAGGSCNGHESATWLATYSGRHYKEEMTGVADKLGLGKRKMDSISFHAMATAIHANVTQRGGIKIHFNDWAGHRIFETDKALKDRIIENVIKPTTGVFEYAKDTPAKYSQPRECVYWKRRPVLCVAQDIAGLVEEEGGSLAPYKTVHNNQKKLIMTLLIGADHGVGGW